jgi:hypothetical protein
MAYNDQSHTLGEIKQSFIETRLWCHYPDFHRSDFMLRNLRPHALAGTRRDVVQSVMSQRSVALSQRKLSFEIKESWLKGRLMIYLPDTNLCDGAATMETTGWFDWDNTPPFDTWVAYVAPERSQGFLLSWVPERFIEIVNDGIEVNPEQCIAWADHAVKDIPALKEILDVCR